MMGELIPDPRAGKWVSPGAGLTRPRRT